MDYVRIATRIIEARRKKKPAVPRSTPRVSQPKIVSDTVTKPPTEYSCRMEISLTADFEGDVAKSALVKKLKNEIIAAIKTGMTTVSRELQIHGTGVVVKPLSVECVVNSVGLGEGLESGSPDSDED